MNRQTIRTRRGKVPINLGPNDRLIHDAKPPRIYIWLVTLAGIAAGLIIIIIIIRLVLQPGSI